MEFEHYSIRTNAHIAGPTMPRPVELRSKVLSPSTVWLEWKDPTLGRVQQLTDSRYYNVHYRPLMIPAASGAVGRNATQGGAAAAGRTLSVVVKATHVVFYDLRPGTRYEFKVRTVKDAVASAFSETIVNKTYETGMKFRKVDNLVIVSRSFHHQDVGFSFSSHYIMSQTARPG